MQAKNESNVLKKDAVKRKFILSFVINFFFSFTLIVFGPYEIFISNRNEFSFVFKDFWYILAIMGIVYVVISVLILTLLPEKISDFLNTCVFTFTLCCYIQAMFFNKQMETLMGYGIRYSSGTIILNAAEWLAIIFVVFFIKYKKKIIWHRMAIFLSAALTVMQATALISLLLTTDTLQDVKNGYVSTDRMFELSANKNVIVFILDFFDGRTMDNIYATYDPEFTKPLKGFTYYPNATSIHSRTYPSITYMLTGEQCYFDKQPDVYINEAFEKSGFLPTLYNNQIDVGLYTGGDYLGNTAKQNMINYSGDRLQLHAPGIVFYSAKMILFRDLPYFAKERFAYDPSRLNRETVINDPDILNGYPQYVFDDVLFYNNLCSTRLSINDNNQGSFKFYHLLSCHTALYEAETYGIVSFEIIYEFLNQMRNLGLYDDATIIITTDHGNSNVLGTADSLDMPHKTAVPIMFVKPSGSGTEEMKISYAPVSHTEFIPTILGGFGFEYSDYGERIYDIPEDSTRDRYYYFTAAYSDMDGEIELREYKVTGDARKEENYHFTGNKWDIQYSLNIVKKR